MDDPYMQAIRQVSSLAFHLADIESVLSIAEEFNDFSFLAKEIRWHMDHANLTAPDDIARARRIIHGDYSR